MKILKVRSILIPILLLILKLMVMKNILMSIVVKNKQEMIKHLH